MQRVLIVGGVAGGASCAARLRRLSEAAQIMMFERGNYVSFANCGLPYHVGGVIPEESSLLVANVAKFNNWFNVDVKINTEVVAIDRAARKVTARDGGTGQEAQYEYDALVLAPGAAAIRPTLPGIDLPGIFAMKTIPDVRQVKQWIAQTSAKSAVVVGGGFIGLEMAENLMHLGLDTSVVEMLPQVMPPFDAEMVEPLHAHMRAKGCKLHLGDGVAGFEQGAGGKGLVVKTQSGAAHPADLVMLVIGVRPEVGLAKSAGLELGPRGGIKVDDHMRTSDPHIYAVGDAVEVKDWVTGQPALIPLAGPANRQGRIAADVIMGKEPSKFRGTQGTAVVGVLGMTCASTGASERTLKRAGLAYEKVYVHDGKILGCQATGVVAGVEKRVDVVAMCMQMGGTVFDLEEAELCYAPQYGSAKDPVNIAGMAAANIVRGDALYTSWNGSVPGALNLPLSSLRKRMGEVPAGRKLYVYCQVGLRGYYATRQLLLAGHDAVNISGGYKSYKDFKASHQLQGGAANGAANGAKL
ncbi:hypothetical protein CHLNCDRAFT_48889 [Chlorella variabilis]|uniref:Rhodanese domain-containing protein n=1 Tax=Chlorella variabilis TaxID=554065 RepID=E1ZGZ0_CHLVA|nr:hypothetical protein CHLNCDRAFT_48889 [Chlorella variabilis]EFN54835.1 hypothetical protein CHLNCDRAFT_48889 [Chlorella variabilis]|eukprot:XP_005846937.1 hypothetical protein CHLNCDRAFT_48889 [Chlorella variabilis]